MVAHGVAVSCALKDSEPSLAGDRQFDMRQPWQLYRYWSTVGVSEMAGKSRYQ